VTKENLYRAVLQRVSEHMREALLPSFTQAQNALQGSTADARAALVTLQETLLTAIVTVLHAKH
jgi:hypothetical protein